MSYKTDTQRTLELSVNDVDLVTWIEAFLIDRKATGVAEGTLRFYQVKLRVFSRYCESLAINQVSQITPSVLRQFMLYLVDTGHRPGGCHAEFRTIRAFFLWYENELEPKGWMNPIRKVKPPKVPIDPLEPVSIEVMRKMMMVCKRGTFTGDRDFAILICLLDTGARAQEFLDMDLKDVNQATGEILIRMGKGRKPRTVYIGRQSRRALRRYIRLRNDQCPALWVVHPRFETARLGYDGLRSILDRRAQEARVEKPSPHAFRRAFALTMLRNGTDVFTLAKLMGHQGITVLQRYLKQSDSDIEQAHRKAGPVDHFCL